MKGSSIWPWLVTVLALSANRSALAQGLPPAAEITAPTAIDVGQVVYPPGAHADAAIVLEVTIDAAGHVESARAVEGEEPFGSAAVDAARAWTFVPGKRGLEGAI